MELKGEINVYNKEKNEIDSREDGERRNDKGGVIIKLLYHCEQFNIQAYILYWNGNACTFWVLNRMQVNWTI